MDLNNQKKYDLIFLGLAKNVEKTIYNFFKSCENLANSGLHICVIIGENDSSDNTKEILKKFQSTKFNFINLNTDFLNIYKNRIVRISHGRQYLKNFLIKNNIKSKFVSVVDLDNIISSGIDTNNFIKTLDILKKENKSIFGISCKSKPYYYDMLPLVIKDYYEFDVYKIQTTFSLFNFYLKRKKFIYDFQKKITSMRDILTLSSHNGLTTYNYEEYILGNYLGKKNSEIKSEHLNFNIEIHRLTNKFILMTNKLILSTPTEHYPINFLEFIKKYIVKIFKR